MKRILTLILLILISLCVSACDMGTPAPSQSKIYKAPKEYKTLTVILKDGQFFFISLYKESANSWTATYPISEGKNVSKKVYSNDANEIAKQIYGNKVKEARWTSR